MRNAVTHLGEESDGRRADGLGRRVRRGEVGMVRLEPRSSRTRAVVLGVGDLRRVVRVVLLVVCADWARNSSSSAGGVPAGVAYLTRAIAPASRPRLHHDTGAHDGVGVLAVVERHRLARGDQPLRVIEADLDAAPPVPPRTPGRPGTMGARLRQHQGTPTGSRSIQSRGSGTPPTCVQPPAAPPDTTRRPATSTSIAYSRLPVTAGPSRAAGPR